MFGFETTIYGRFRRAWIRWARRIGRRERVKFAEEKRASVLRGGRPCLACELGLIRGWQSPSLPDEVCKTQGVKRFGCEIRNLFICNRPRRPFVKPPTMRESEWPSGYHDAEVVDANDPNFPSSSLSLRNLGMEYLYLRV